MPSLFSRLKGGKDGKAKKKQSQLDHLTNQLQAKPKWEDAFARKTVEPEEIHELVRGCTEELKARALDLPFLLLPFRPTSDPSAVRTFIRHYFDSYGVISGEALAQELRMAEPMVISGVIKWCWSRLQGGLVGWDAYELFRSGEVDSQLARDSFKTFIPLSVENGARSRIIFDFFDLLSAIAAHGKMNGFGGRKLSRMAAWWTFEQKDTESGFEGGYKAWLSAADATSHLFFAYLRSLAPAQNKGGISILPMSLQKLLQETEYPPQRPSLMQSSTNKVVMIVNSVSPTPFALLRRGNHFQYRDEDRALREFSEYEDPVQALTEECRRVLKAISAANQTQAVSSSKHSTSLRDASWSRFEDIGFSSTLAEADEEDENARKPQGLRSTPMSGGADGLARPTTPSWADFLSSGFVDDGPNTPTNMLLPPDKQLPPIDAAVRQRSSQSHRPRLESNQQVEPGELASITRFDLDDSFWWVWMSSLAPEETPERKAAFGRCAVIETRIRTGRWLVMEEMIKGAAKEPDAGAYVAEKKGFFSWTRRNKNINRSKSVGKHALDKNQHQNQSETFGYSKTNIGPDQQARIQAAAQQLHARQLQQEQQAAAAKSPGRRGRSDQDVLHEKTNSVMTLQPVIVTEASSAMKWANKYDKESRRAAYLADPSTGRGLSQTDLALVANGVKQSNGMHTNGYEQRPQVPEKMHSPLPASPVTQKPQPQFAEKSLEAPSDIHPVERNEAGRSSPLPPPPKDEPQSLEVDRDQMISPEPVDTSPKDKKAHKKLHKEPKEAGGFRKLFGRKNRQSKLPENAAADVNGMLAERALSPEPVHQYQQPQPPQPAPLQSQTNLAPPAMSRAESEFVTPREEPSDPMPHMEHEPAGMRTPTAREPIHAEPSLEDLSRVDSNDAREAHEEFSRFDQGPLDAPAFVPDDSDTETEDAIPPPIARQRSPAPPSPVIEAPPLKQSAPVEQAPASQVPPAIDRWAQIRKNAADRAAQRKPEDAPTRGPPTTDGEDDTSGEETIESRVARIKARVAELTGNMENVSGPGTRTPPGPRR